MDGFFINRPNFKNSCIIIDRRSTTMEEENQNRADENSPDNASGNVIPMSETLRLAGFCREVAETARDMHRFCKKALKFFDHVDTPFEDKKNKLYLHRQ